MPRASRSGWCRHWAHRPLLQASSLARWSRNISRRFPAAEAAQLREDIDNAKLYEELTGGLARINIECTLQLRSAKDGSGDSAESKKTPVRNVCGALRRNRSLYRESQSEPKP